MQSLFVPMEKEGLTTLKIRYNYKTEKFLLEAGKHWNEHIKWSMYNKKFCYDDILTEDSMHLNHREVIDLFNKYGLAGYLNTVIGLIKKGKHFGIDCYYHKG